MNVKLLQDCFALDPTTGWLTWKERDISGSRNARFAGRRAGAPKGNGYRVVRVDGRLMLEHRVVWALANGRDPGEVQVDHVNGVRDDNRPANLRLATNAENVRRRHRLNVNNTSGEHGVYRHAAAGKWVAAIKVDGKRIHLGLFADIAQARDARRLAEFQHFGRFSPCVEDGAP